MTPAERRAFVDAVGSLPAKHRAWLGSDSIDLFAYYGWGIVLNDAQTEALTAVQTWPRGSIHLWRFANRAGKAQPIDEPVLTPTGWRRIGDLGIGDEVIAGDGRATRVTGVFPQGLQPIVRVTFDDGATTRCTPDHLWRVWSPSARFRTYEPNFERWTVMPLSRIQERWGARPLPPARCAIPVVRPVEHKPEVVPLDPYALGLLLGDGHFQDDGAVTFSSMDQDLLDALGKVAVVRRKGRRRSGCDYTVKGLSGVIRSLGLTGTRSHTKFIPEPYLYNTAAVRLALLQGLLDTDGSAGAGVEYTSTSERLADGVVALVRSLGGKARKVRRVTRYTYKGEMKDGRPSFRVRIRLHGLPLFRLARKTKRIQRRRWRPERLLYSIEDAGEAEAVCIAVEAADGTYVTNDHIVTHNTTACDLLHLWAIFRKWAYRNDDMDAWLDFSYKTLHTAPLNRLMGKAWELVESLIAGSAWQQRSPITSRQRPALLAPFFRARVGKTPDGSDAMWVECGNGGRIDFLSTHDGAGRMESDTWWLISWDEFVRQQPVEDIPLLFDQTFLPRTSDFMAPLILSGTVTEDSDPIYAEMEEIAQEHPRDWNILSFDRSVNFSQSADSIARQRRLTINPEIAARSVDGRSGEGGRGSLFPTFLLRTAFDPDLPPDMTADEIAALRAEGYEFISMFDHAARGDLNVVQTWAVPWPVPEGDQLIGRIRAVGLAEKRSGHHLTPTLQTRFCLDEVDRFGSRLVIVDGTAEGGLLVYRGVREEIGGLRALNCVFNARRPGTSTPNKEYGLQSLQRMLSWGLDVQATENGWITDWPETERGAFGLLRMPFKGRWLKLHRELAVLRRDDQRQRQDRAMTAVMGAWWLGPQVEARRRGAQAFSMVPRRRPPAHRRDSLLVR